jgi:hypothetical protein
MKIVSKHKHGYVGKKVSLVLKRGMRLFGWVQKDLERINGNRDLGIDGNRDLG